MSRQRVSSRPKPSPNGRSPRLAISYARQDPMCPQSRDPVSIAKAAAKAVLDERQHELDRMEPVLTAMTAVIAAVHRSEADPERPRVDGVRTRRRPGEGWPLGAGPHEWQLSRDQVQARRHCTFECAELDEARRGRRCAVSGGRPRDCDGGGVRRGQRCHCEHLAGRAAVPGFVPATGTNLVIRGTSRKAVPSCKIVSPKKLPRGGMAEWSMAVVLKTTERVTVPGVRIPLPPTFVRLYS